jgi:hypothetical protein
VDPKQDSKRLVLNNCAIVEAYHLPQLAVCVQCFDEEAGPELEEKKAVSLSCLI